MQPFLLEICPCLASMAIGRMFGIPGTRKPNFLPNGVWIQALWAHCLPCGVCIIALFPNVSISIDCLHPTMGCDAPLSMTHVLLSFMLLMSSVVHVKCRYAHLFSR